MEAIGISISDNLISVMTEKDKVFTSAINSADNSTKAIKENLKSEKIKIFYDAKPVIKELIRSGFEINGPIFDIKIASMLIGGDSLEEKELPTVKDLIPLREKLVKEITKNNLVEVCKLEFDCIFAVVQMELNGIRLDTDKWQKLNDKYLAEQKDITDELQNEFGIENLNLNSPLQMLKAFESKNIYLKSTNQHELSEYKGDNRIVEQFLEYRRVTKAIQSFLAPIPQFLDQENGRIHPSYNQLGALSGRFSCEGPNIQQIPRDNEFRECFIPDKGNKLIIADYSQIELRVAAEVANDETMIEAYKNGIDLHLLTASIVTGKELKDVTKQERQAAKAMNFGLIYGMGAKGFQIYAKSTYGVVLSLKEAISFRNKFFDAYKGIAEWHKKTDAMINVFEYRTLSGRRVVFDTQPGISTRLNVPVQGTAADIIKRALGDLSQKSEENGFRILATVHDEILLESTEKTALKASQELKKAMETAGSFYIKKVPIIAEAKITDSWAEK